MIRQDIMNGLSKHAFLQGISQRHLETLAGFTQQVTMTAGQHLGREREAANAFYLIQSGRVAIEVQKQDRGTARLQTIGPGEIVGWSWLVPPHFWQFDARVAEPVQALALDAERLRRQCADDHELGYELLTRLINVVAGRLAASRRKLLDLYPSELTAGD